jgi:pSer/pThr/pTyr-binding forkhead associated (FHA) protein
LIVDGVQIFSLNLTLVNIGRQAENHLVIEDPRVSRRHAQLRVIEGRFVVFDLDSTGGTLVNGKAIHQHRLSPGDVISLAGVPLVYGQEDIPPDSTQRINLPS